MGSGSSSWVGHGAVTQTGKTGEGGTEGAALWQGRFKSVGGEGSKTRPDDPVRQRPAGDAGPRGRWEVDERVRMVEGLHQQRRRG